MKIKDITNQMWRIVSGQEECHRYDYSYPDLAQYNYFLTESPQIGPSGTHHSITKQKCCSCGAKEIISLHYEKFGGASHISWRRLF